MQNPISSFLAIIAYTLLYTFEPANGIGYPNVDRRWLYIGVTIGAGIVGGLLFGLIWQLGLIILGAVGGLFAGLFLSGLLSNVLPSWGGIAIIVALAVIGMIAIWVLQTPIIIISTAVAGAVSIFWGIGGLLDRLLFATRLTNSIPNNHTIHDPLSDFFIKTSFNQMLTVLFKGQFSAFTGWTWTGALIGMVVGCGCAMVLGALFQFLVFRSHPWKPAKGGGGCSCC